MKLPLPTCLWPLIPKLGPIYHNLLKVPFKLPLLITALATEAVPSGRSVQDLSPLSTNVYISLLTTSVPSPIPLTKRSVISIIGVLISLTCALNNCSFMIFSTFCHIFNCSGRRSVVPLRFFRLFKIVNNSRFEFWVINKSI